MQTKQSTQLEVVDYELEIACISLMDVE